MNEKDRRRQCCRECGSNGGLFRTGPGHGLLLVLPAVAAGVLRLADLARLLARRRGPGLQGQDGGEVLVEPVPVSNKAGGCSL